MVGMLEAFELDCFALKWLKNIAACSPGYLHSGCGGRSRMGPQHPAGAGRHLEMVPASNCPEVRNRHDNIIGTPAVNWLGNLTTTWQEIEQEPNILEFGLGPVP